jgi:hypothetical protein
VERPRRLVRLARQIEMELLRVLLPRPLRRDAVGCVLDSIS